MISIITPVWNRSDLTNRWLYQNWAFYAGHTGIEWIIVDNGSTDETTKSLCDWHDVMGDKLKTLSLTANIGFGPGNNLGAEVADGDILAFISNDVQVLGDYITPIEMSLSSDREKFLYGPEVWDNNTGWNT
ncbi:MAG: glycosyltransferase family 2 protein, partial [Planctomycetota bacterium]